MLLANRPLPLQWFAAIVEQSATLLETTVTKVRRTRPAPAPPFLAQRSALLLVPTPLRPPQINWFANVCNLTSLVSYTLVPSLCRRYSVRTLAIGAAALNIVGAWIRYGGIRASDPSVQWGIVLFGQMINGFATPSVSAPLRVLFRRTFADCRPPRRLSLALGTKYSEAWFPLRERTTATMLLTVRARGISPGLVLVALR